MWRQSARSGRVLRQKKSKVLPLDPARLSALRLSMKEIIIKVDDELYDRAKESVADLESSVNEHVRTYLRALNGDDEHIAAARSRMKELFSSTTGFVVGQKLSREEMHERGSVR